MHIEDEVAAAAPARAPRCTELTRLELQYLHNQAIGIAAQFREFFPNVVRPSFCPFDHRVSVAPKPGTLAALMPSGRMP